jgi:hypothetical protein
MDWEKVGEVTHYFNRVGVAVIALVERLEVGDWIGFVRNEELLFEQEVTSMQVEHENIMVAEAGDDIGLQVAHKVKNGTEVYRLLQEA